MKINYRRRKEEKEGEKETKVRKRTRKKKSGKKERRGRRRTRKRRNKLEEEEKGKEFWTKKSPLLL